MLSSFILYVIVSRQCRLVHKRIHEPSKNKQLARVSGVWVGGGGVFERTPFEDQ